MNNFKDRAFDAAAIYCECDEDSCCTAGAYYDGYVAGYLKAIEEAAEVAGQLDCHILATAEMENRVLKQVQEQIQAMTEGEGQ